MLNILQFPFKCEDFSVIFHWISMVLKCWLNKSYLGMWKSASLNTLTTTGKQLIVTITISCSTKYFQVFQGRPYCNIVSYHLYKPHTPQQPRFEKPTTLMMAWIQTAESPTISTILLKMLTTVTVLCCARCLLFPQLEKQPIRAL